MNDALADVLREYKFLAGILVGIWVVVSSGLKIFEVWDKYNRNRRGDRSEDGEHQSPVRLSLLHTKILDVDRHLGNLAQSVNRLVEQMAIGHQASREAAIQMTQAFSVLREDHVRIERAIREARRSGDG